MSRRVRSGLGLVIVLGIVALPSRRDARAQATDATAPPPGSMVDPIASLVWPAMPYTPGIASFGAFCPTGRDGCGRPTRSSGWRGEQRFGYDAQGRLASIESVWANGDRTDDRLEHDADGRLAVHAHTSHGHTLTERFQRDAAGLLVARTIDGTSSGGHEVHALERYEHDARGRLVARRDLDRLLVFERDGGGRVTAQLDCSNALSREMLTALRSIVTPCDEHRLTLRWDDRGRLASIAEGEHQRAFVYDDRGHLREVRRRIGGTETTERYERDRQGRLVTIIEGPRMTTRIRYD